MTVFLVFTTNFLLLIGAGLFSKSVGSFEADKFNRLCVLPPFLSCNLG